MLTNSVQCASRAVGRSRRAKTVVKLASTAGSDVLHYLSFLTRLVLITY